MAKTTYANLRQIFQLFHSSKILQYSENHI